MRKLALVLLACFWDSKESEVGPPGLSTIFDRCSSNFALNCFTCFLVGVFVSSSSIMVVGRVL